MKKLALVTGASAGFGEAIAHVLAELGYNLILTARRDEKLSKVASKIKRKYAVEITELVFDVRDREKTEEVVLSHSNQLKNIDVLVNNAGLALGRSPIQEGEIDDWDTMIDTNIKGLLYMTRLISPYMVEKKSGHIINIGSIAGKETYPNGNVYCATKHAVEAITKGTRQDLLPYNVKVSSICPGAADTEFSEVRYKGDEQKANSVYEGFQPLLAEDIAETLKFMVTRPSHVNLNDVVITCTAQADSFFIHKKNQ